MNRAEGMKWLEVAPSLSLIVIDYRLGSKISSIKIV